MYSRKGQRELSFSAVYYFSAGMELLYFKRKSLRPKVTPQLYKVNVFFTQESLNREKLRFLRERQATKPTYRSGQRDADSHFLWRWARIVSSLL